MGWRDRMGKERRLEELYGAGEPEALFHGDVALVPWPRHPRRPEPGALDQVRALLRSPVHLFDVDPRSLLATQPKLVRHHFDHYAVRWREYWWFAHTSADPDSELNRFPVVQPDGDGRFIIRSGHHRAAAALVEGTALRCRVVGWPSTGDAIAVTPTLMVGARADVAVITAVDVGGSALAADRIRRRGATVTAASLEVAQHVLFQLRCEPSWAATLLRRSFPGAEVEPLDESTAPPQV